MKKKLFIFGLSGYVSSHLINAALQLEEEFDEIYGTSLRKTNSNDKVKEFVLQNNRLSLEGKLALMQATHILITVAPIQLENDYSCDLVLFHHHAELEEAVLHGGRVIWVGYLSTTGVYGNTDGKLVTEEDGVLNPSTKRGKARVLAEAAWRKTGYPIHIFRLPGIYGPNRGPLSKIRNGEMKEIVVNKRIKFSRIHVDDIVQGLLLSMRKPNPGRIYNLCDDLPVGSHVVNEYCCNLLGNGVNLPLVDFEVANLSEMARSFYVDSKICSNERIKKELNLVLKYPTYKVGMLAQLEMETRSNNFSNLKEKAPTATQASVGGFYTYSTFSDLKAFFLNLLKQVLVSLTSALNFYFWKLRWNVWDARIVLLIDNGSLKPASTLALRRVCDVLARMLNVAVVPISTKFSDRITDLSLLNGVKPNTLASSVEFAAKNKGRLLVVPLFIGPSETINKEIVPCFQGEKMTPFLSAGDDLLVDLLVQAVLHTARKNKLSRPYKVVMVDHGTPKYEVNMVRRILAAKMRRKLFPSLVIDASMERRLGKEYDFNEPLLESVFDCCFLDGDVIVCMAFLLPGAHAGVDGDVENILKTCKEKKPSLRTYLTPLIMDEANDHMLMKLLQARIMRASNI